MSDRPTSVEGVPDDALDRIRERVLEREREQLNYKQVHGLRPDLKEIVEEEVTEEHIE